MVTHGHADHARSGHGAVWATPETLAIMALRYGTEMGTPVPYGEGFEDSGRGRPRRNSEINDCLEKCLHIGHKPVELVMVQPMPGIFIFNDFGGREMFDTPVFFGVRCPAFLTI